MAGGDFDQPLRKRNQFGSRQITHFKQKTQSQTFWKSCGPLKKKHISFWGAGLFRLFASYCILDSFLVGKFLKKGVFFFLVAGVASLANTWQDTNCTEIKMPKGSLNGCWHNFQGASDHAGKAVLERILCPCSEKAQQNSKHL